MPKIDIASVPKRQGSSYPAPFHEKSQQRIKQALGAGLTQFGVNLVQLPPGEWSSQRHWHTDEDEFVYVLSGELVLIEDDGETVLRAGECAAFPKNTGNGHHLINRSGKIAVYLEVGSDIAEDAVYYSDIDMTLTNQTTGFTRKYGRPYPKR